MKIRIEKKVATARDSAIIANYRREISLQTRFVKNAKAYTRKCKHKYSAMSY